MAEFPALEDRPPARLPMSTRPAQSVCTLLIVLIFCGSLAAADWPGYRAGNARPAATAEQLTTPLESRWVDAAPAPPRLAWAGPDMRVIEGHELRHRVRFDDVFHVAVAGGRVYYGSSVDHALRCKDAATGRELWRFFTGGPIRLAPTISNDRVLFGSDDGYVYCLNAENGQLVWKLHGGPVEDWIIGRGEMISRWPVRTGVTVVDGVAYFAAGLFPHEDVFLYAVSTDDGSLVWKRDNISETEAGRNDLSPQGHLLASDEFLFVPSGRSLPAAVDLKTGEIAYKRFVSWRREAGGPVGGSRAMLADGQLYAGGDHHTLAMDQKTGKVGFGWFDGREIAVAGDAAFLSDGEHVSRLERLAFAEESRNRHKLQLEANEERRNLWKAKYDPEKFTEEDVARFEARYEQLKAQIAESRKVGVVWQTACELESALLATGGHLFAGGENRVAAFDLETGEEVWSADVDGEARGLAAADGHLFVSTTTGRVYCFASADQPSVAIAEAAGPVEQPFPPDDLTAVYEAAAEEILNRTGVRRGFCLVVDSQLGRLAYQLARRSDLKIYCVESDARNVAQSRRALHAAGYYGHRIVVHHRDSAEIPYSNYFANLVVSDALVSSGRLPSAPGQLARHVKPMGGTVGLGRPENAPGSDLSTSQLRDCLEQMQLADQTTIDVDGSWALLERGELPGAGSWSHLYGEPGNTASSEDRRVKGGLGVLWFGDPGPGKMVNRHEGAVGPLAVNGRLYIQGQTSIMAYDAYNGQLLWERGNEQAQRTGVFQNYNPGNLVAGDDSLFVMIKDECLQLVGATGEVKATFRIPAGIDEKSYEWGYLAYRDGRLFGTATVREEVAGRLRRRGRTTLESTDAIFAIDVESGRHLWTYKGRQNGDFGLQRPDSQAKQQEKSLTAGETNRVSGGSISHHTIALGPDRVYFIDSSITPEQRAELLNQDKSELKKLSGEEARQAEERMKQLDVRLAVALDAQTGDKLWSKPVDVTDCSEIGTGGGQLTLMYQNNVLVLCGANANGHYWKQFLEGEFSKRRLVALSADEGQKLWAKDANYRHRPIIVEDRIIAEPWGFDLYTGAQQMREHPLTGQPVPWSIIRPGHHCGMLTGSPNMLMFRSGYTGFFDLEKDAGTRHFAGHRLGCWINAIPANGLVMIPEASAGCVCLFSIAATVTLEPREARRPWAIFSSVGPSTPVAHMALNLGAPGDRRDARGTPWLAYPRPKPGKETGLDLKLDLNESFADDGRFISRSERSATVDNADAPWLYTSAARGLSRLSLPLLGEGDPPATYTVKLYFAELDANLHSENPQSPTPGTGIFDVKLQGRTVIENLDIAAEMNGRVPLAKPVPPIALVREIPNIKVTNNLLVELVPKSDNPSAEQAPLLNAIEVERTESSGTE